MPKWKKIKCGKIKLLYIVSNTSAGSMYISNIYFVHLIKKYRFSNKYSTIINNFNSCNIYH